MATIPYYIGLGFGIIVAVMGVRLFARMGARGSNLIKLSALQFKLSGSALVIFVVGCVIVVFSLMQLTKGQSVGSTTDTARTASVMKPSVDLSGDWSITNTVEQSTYRPFRGLRIGYRVFVTNSKNEFVAKGEKRSENGVDIPSTARTPIEISGKLSDAGVAVTCTERGAQRDTSGEFTLQVVSPDLLRGYFASTAADSKGSSEWRRSK